MVPLFFRGPTPGLELDGSASVTSPSLSEDDDDDVGEYVGRPRCGPGSAKVGTRRPYSEIDGPPDDMIVEGVILRETCAGQALFVRSICSKELKCEGRCWMVVRLKKLLGGGRCLITRPYSWLRGKERTLPQRDSSSSSPEQLERGWNVEVRRKVVEE